MAGMIKAGEKYFPEKLMEFTPDVEKIYYEGDLSLLESPCISVVGSRKCSSYGKIVARTIGKQVAASGITVVSGLAVGIDAESHMGALEVGGNTVAVLAGGTDCFYPAQNKEIQKRISEKGLLISLKPLGYKPRAYDFPIRNRIISALGESVVIVEAESRSGALITAECAMEQGKNVYAVPGNITSISSFGTNTLIKEGAQPLTLIDELITDLNITPGEKAGIYNKLGKDEIIVYNAIKETGEATIDEIYHKTNINTSVLNGIITLLEMKGLVFVSMGKVFVAKF